MGNIKFGHKRFGQYLFGGLRWPVIVAGVVTFGVLISLAIYAFGETASSKFTSTSIPEVGDAGTGWGTNLRAYLLSVDGWALTVPDFEAIACSNGEIWAYSDSAGEFVCSTDGGSDNLGNHTATQALDLNTNDVINSDFTLDYFDSPSSGGAGWGYDYINTTTGRRYWGGIVERSVWDDSNNTTAFGFYAWGTSTNTIEASYDHDKTLIMELIDDGAGDVMFNVEIYATGYSFGASDAGRVYIDASDGVDSRAYLTASMYDENQKAGMEAVAGTNSSTTTLYGDVVMPGEAGTAGWYVKLDGSGNVSLADPGGSSYNAMAVGSTVASATANTQQFAFVAGDNISLAVDTTARSLTITATAGTAGNHGLDSTTHTDVSAIAETGGFGIIWPAGGSAWEGTDIATQAEIDALTFSDIGGSVSDAQVPDDVTIATSALSGTITSAQIAADMARDSELFGGNFSDLAGSATDAQVPDDITVATSKNITISKTGPAIKFDDSAANGDWQILSSAGTVFFRNYPGGISTATTGLYLQEPVGTSGYSVVVAGDALGPGVLGLQEDRDNGTSSAFLKGPDSLGASVTATMPSSTGTLALTSQLFGGNFSDLAGSITDAQVPDDITIDGTANVTDASLPTSASFNAVTSTTIELGHASDTTLARSGAGDVTIEGNAVYRAGGTDVPIGDGGTGASTAAAARANLEAGPPLEAFVISGSALTVATYPLFKAQVAITITDIHCITDTGTVIMELEEGTATAFDGGAVVDATITCDSNGAEDDGTLTNGTIDAGDWIAARIGTEASSPTMLGVTFYYTVD